jgi:hypothetical protein
VRCSSGKAGLVVAVVPRVRQSDWNGLRADLEAAGVDSTDFGRFVNRVTPGVVEASSFDAEPAIDVLIRWLPRAEDKHLRWSIVGHLKTTAARGIAGATLLDEFRRSDDEMLRWHIGDTLQTVATPEEYDDIVALAGDTSYGMSRQMLVDMLWRVKTDRSRQTLVRGIQDPDVALHAGSALRRLVGNDKAAALLEPLTDHENEQVARAARQNLNRARKALSRRRL